MDGRVARLGLSFTESRWAEGLMGPIDSGCGEVGRGKNLSDLVVLGFFETWDEVYNVWVWLGRAVICTMRESLLENNPFLWARF